MQTLISGLGWIMLILIMAGLVTYLYTVIRDFLFDLGIKRRKKIESEINIEISRQINEARHWMNDPKRKPFELLLGYISDKIRDGVMISGDFSRQKVDEIISSGKLSDGYHTFEELYEFRKIYNAALFNEWGKQYQHESSNPTEGPVSSDRLFDVHKSKRHHDGELCFGGGWFIVVAILPAGQISNHYKIEDWDLFDIPEYTNAKHPFDGHTSHDVINRLKSL